MYFETFATKNGMYVRRKSRVKLNDECVLAKVYEDGCGCFLCGRESWIVNSD